MNRRTDRQRKRGSLTVEASLVVPMCVMILALLYTFAAGIRRLPVKQPCRGADMAYWRDEADRRKQRKNGKQGAGRVDFPDRMLPVE